MTFQENNFVYELLFRVKCSRADEFEKHCRDVMGLLDNHSGFLSLAYSKRTDIGAENGFCTFRCEIFFNSQDSLNSYQKNIVPKIRSSSTQFGEDAKIKERRAYKIFCTKSA